MLADPEFYGLTYDAYQMLTFDIEDFRKKMSRNEKSDENLNEDSEENLKEKILYDLEFSKNKGPSIPEAEDLPFDAEEILKEYEKEKNEKNGDFAKNENLEEKEKNEKNGEFAKNENLEEKVKKEEF